MPDFNEFSLEMFDLCLKLLVKIEEDKSELIVTFIDRYKYLISRKFDEIFGMKEGVNEIDYNTYLKIYDNFEFAINENEFLFYEQQIAEINNNHTGDKSTMNLTSKLLKKGTFIWICKKVHENIVSYFMGLAYRYFIGLFDKSHSEKMNIIYSYIIELFYKKVKDLLEKSKTEIFDPVFFKEGLTSFYYPMREVLHKLQDENIQAVELSEKILENNQKLADIYISIYLDKFVIKSAEIIKCDLVKENSFIYEKKKLFNDANLTLVTLNNMLFDNLMLLKKLDLSLLYNTSPDETMNLYYNKIISFITHYYFVFKSANFKFINLHLKHSTSTEEEICLLKTNINNIFNNTNQLYRIYYKIALYKVQLANIKHFVEKILKEFPQIKNNRQLSTELKAIIDKELAETSMYLYDSLILVKDKEYFEVLKRLFFDVDWFGIENVISFRLELRDLLYDVYKFKVELFDLLDEEKKHHNETKSNSINELMMNKKKINKLTKFQKEMECLHIRRLSIYSDENESPQNILSILTKIIFKDINEFIKVKKFNTGGFQQMQIDINLAKYFFRENIIIDTENILDGYFLEIMKNVSFNCSKPESFDDTVNLNLMFSLLLG
jgi:hypothetical protein